MKIFLLDVFELDCNKQYEICLFGITDDNNSVCVRIHDYPLYIYAVKKTKGDLSEMESDTIEMNLFEEDSKTVEISRIRCDNLQEYYGERKKLKETHTLCNTQLATSIQFLHHKDIKPSSFINVDNGMMVKKSKQRSRCDIELFAGHESITKLTDGTSQIPNLLSVSFDIETTTDCLTSYPVSSRKNDKVVQIGFTLRRLNDSKSKKMILCLGDCAPIPDATVLTYKTEKELLIGFGEVMQQEDPDIIVGFNTFGYDYPYLFDRAKFHDILKLINLSRYNYPNKKEEFTIIGRVNLDLLWYCRNYGDKLPQYKLSFLCKHYKLDQGKIDLAYSEIFRRYSYGGTAEEKQEVAVYCIRDCEVLHDLGQKLNAVHNLIGLSQTCYLPLNILILRKQSAKVISLVMKECYDVKYMIPLKKMQQDMGGKYQGATVLTAKKGVYRDPVSVLDFASLYPSCMIAENLCPSTKVTSSLAKGAKKISFGKKVVYGNCIEWMISLDENKYNSLGLPWEQHDLPDESRDRVWIRFQKVKGFMNEIQVTQNCYFLQNKPGIIPQILKKLLSERKKIKRMVKQSKDPFLKKIYDGLQKSYKIVANSVYGQLGAKFGAIGNVDIASCITAVARNLLESTQEYVLENYEDLDIVYGDTDSVFVLMRGKSLEETVKISNEISEKFSKTLPKPHLLEYEKIYCPFMLFSKKRYAGLKIERITDKPKEDTKGIVLSRRDNCKLLKTIYHECLKHILDNQVSLALMTLNQKTSDLSRYALENFVITKKIGENYKIEPAHYSLYRKVKQRNPGSSYRVGDRMSYCYIRSSLKLLKDRIETPDFIEENQLKLDYAFYISNQLMKPLLELFSLIDVNTGRKAQQIMSENRTKHSGQKIISDFFKVR